MKRLYLILLYLIPALTYSQTGVWSDKLVYMNASIEIGDDGSTGACYSWTAVPADPSIVNLKTPKITVNPTQTTTYTRTTIGQDFSSVNTNQVKVWVLTGIAITLLQTSVCDGEESNVRVEPIPSSIPIPTFVSALTNVNFISTTVAASGGNPAGTTALVFDPINASAISKIQRGLWYSTQADHCNDESRYEIEAVATISGNSVRSNKPIFTVRATLGPGNCLNGTVNSTNQWFSGVPDVTATQRPDGSWQGNIGLGTFRKNVVVTANYTAPANSQFHNMVRDEELFHKGQWEGTNASVLLNDLFLAQNVINATNAAGPYIGATQVDAIALVNASFIVERDNEITRSLNIAVPYPGARRCATEKEAKNAVGSSYKLALPCTYPACPN